MNNKPRTKSPPIRKRNPISPSLSKINPNRSPINTVLKTVKEETKTDFIEDQERDETTEAFKSEVERFIEISKYFSSPLRKSASYVCENRLISYPNPYRMEYKRGNITTYHIKFCNLILEPVYIKLYKLTPELEEIKFINLTLSRCKRVPPGLSFNLGFVYDDVNEKPAQNAKMIFVASRKSTTPCYQICEIDLHIEALKIRL
ncbi:unnamed protein product [Pieris brassicae]|uniref:Uncharacterized protein n=1 Tax=Pieris brassicae TaxID=7116 RepID=A0A9P0XFU0_PIEBR|nr:unnamed protein product [Pieris brassicae]